MVEVTDADRNFRTAILKHIIETLDRPCSDGDMIDDRNDAFDLFLARHRIAAEQRCKLEGARLATNFRYELAQGDDCAAMRANLSPAMINSGDCVLVWINQGDLMASEVRRALNPAKIVGEG